MNKTLQNILPYLIIAFFLYSCASGGTLSGGPKDETPPKIIAEKSTDKVLTFYDGKPIEVVFDEYVEIRNKKEIVVSPPTQYPIIVKQRGKKVKIKFDKREFLKPDATYYIGLDNIVRDFTEGNKIDSLSFVISKSGTIDDGSYTGEIHFPPNTKRDLYVMMYKINEDSIVTNQKPYYYVRSDNGKFKFNYIKNGAYKIVAFEDGNLNLLYDQNTDWVAYMDTLLVVNDSMPNVVLNAFQPKQPLKVIKKNKKKYGTFSLEYNQPIEDLTCNVLTDSFDVYFKYEEKKVIGRYNNKNRNLKLKCAEDTISIRLARVDSTLFKKNKLELGDHTSVFSPKEEIALVWNTPLQSMNTDSIHVIRKEDTLTVDVPADFMIRNDSIYIEGLEDGKTYQVTFDNLAISDIYGRYNDSITTDISVLSDTLLMDLTIKLDSTFAERQSNIIIELKSKERTIDRRAISYPDSTTFMDLKPEQYNLNIIEDINGDGQWTTGNYWDKRQPEKQKSITLSADHTTHLISWEEQQSIPKNKEQERTPNDNPNSPKKSLRDQPNNGSMGDE